MRKYLMITFLCMFCVALMLGYGCKERSLEPTLPRRSSAWLDDKLFEPYVLRAIDWILLQCDIKLSQMIVGTTYDGIHIDYIEHPSPLTDAQIDDLFVMITLSQRVPLNSYDMRDFYAISVNIKNALTPFFPGKDLDKVLVIAIYELNSLTFRII